MTEDPNRPPDDKQPTDNQPVPPRSDVYESIGANRSNDDAYPGNEVSDFLVGCIGYPVALLLIAIVVAIGLGVTQTDFPPALAWFLFIIIFVLTIWGMVYSYKVNRRFFAIGMISVITLLLLAFGACTLALSKL